MSELQGLDIGSNQPGGGAPPAANLDLNSLYSASQSAYAQQAMMGNMQQPGQNPAYMAYQVEMTMQCMGGWCILMPAQ